VLHVRHDLSENQAWEVLQSIDRSHDPNRGITRNTLTLVAQKLFPSKPRRKPRRVALQTGRRRRGLLSRLRHPGHAASTQFRTRPGEVHPIKVPNATRPHRSAALSPASKRDHCLWRAGVCPANALASGRDRPNRHQEPAGSTPALPGSFRRRYSPEPTPPASWQRGFSGTARTAAPKPEARLALPSTGFQSPSNCPPDANKAPQGMP
jgi:hypothetical protein